MSKRGWIDGAIAREDSMVKAATHRDKFSALVYDHKETVYVNQVNTFYLEEPSGYPAQPGLKPGGTRQGGQPNKD
jgi:hypothetical protein